MGLTAEQQEIILAAVEGKNLLVDACIGSGKTTVLQIICNEIRNKRVLYLTYNKLLKLEAKKKITGANRTVTNYHGFAYMSLKRIGINSGQSDLIRTLIRNKRYVKIAAYDVLLIDEYQDIDQEIAEMLEIIKQQRPMIQIIAVGDMAQKIYDTTTLDVKTFMPALLGDYELMSLSNCFRLSAPYAAMLGGVWQKKIQGVNNNYTVRKASFEEAVQIAANTKPADLLCLGARNGDVVLLLNEPEEKYPQKFNKKTVYASIKDVGGEASLSPTDDVAIFTTFDASKGLEKATCLLFDYTQGYYESRAENNGVKYEILRNVFCVAASRAKREIVYVQSERSPLLLNRQLGTPFATKNKVETHYIAEMFDFKYKEAVDACYDLLELEEIPVHDRTEIDVMSADYNIDLMPCIGIYQEFSYFDKFDYQKALSYYMTRNDQGWKIVDEVKKLPEPKDIIEMVLYLTACSTLHMRYAKQVVEKFISEENTRKLHARLAEVLTRDERVQVSCEIKTNKFKAKGVCDVLTRDTVYELKFVQDPAHEHFLQLACYMIALNKKRGVLWNTRTNKRFLVTVPNEEIFLQYVEATITKKPLPLSS